MYQSLLKNTTFELYLLKQKGGRKSVACPMPSWKQSKHRVDPIESILIQTLISKYFLKINISSFSAKWNLNQLVLSICTLKKERDKKVIAIISLMHDVFKVKDKAITFKLSGILILIRIPPPTQQNYTMYI